MQGYRIVDAGHVCAIGVQPRFRLRPLLVVTVAVKHMLQGIETDHGINKILEAGSRPESSHVRSDIDISCQARVGVEFEKFFLCEPHSHRHV